MYQIDEKMKKLKVNPFCNFGEDWAVVTAGTKDDFKCMTIAWGQLGTLWSKPVATVYISPIRYTYGFMETNDFFTICFFDERYREDLNILGFKSGRDSDKLSLTKLTLTETENGLSYAQAKLTFVCRKIYAQDFDMNRMGEYEKSRYCFGGKPHRQYIGEVIDIIEN